MSKFYERLTKAVGGKKPTQVDYAVNAMLVKNARAPREHARFGRLDRKREVAKRVEEGTLQPSRTVRVRSAPAFIDPAQVDRFLDSVPEAIRPTDAEGLTALIGRLYGYGTREDMDRAARRADRWGDRKQGRMPSHIRRAAVMASAVAVALASRFPDALDDTLRGRVATARSAFAGATA